MKNICVIVFIALCVNANAQSITVSGEVTKQLKLTMKDIERYPQVEVKAKDREGKEHTFKGTPLATVLDSAGVTLGKNLRGENLSKYVSSPLQIITRLSIHSRKSIPSLYRTRCFYVLMLMETRCRKEKDRFG